MKTLHNSDVSGAKKNVSDWNNKDDDFNHKTRAVDALKYIYKHLQGDMNITEDEAINKACDTLCNLIGDQAFQKFLEDDVE